MKMMLRATIKKYIKLLISVTLIASLGFSLSWGLSSGYSSLERSLNGYVEDYGYPDALITTEITTSSDLDKLLRIDGVQGCDTRLFADTLMKTSGEDHYSVRVFSYSDSEKQSFYRWSESDGGDGVLIEYNFAQSNGINAGDTLSFRVRDEYRDYKVSAIVSRPETLSAKISDDAWGLNYDFGYIYAPSSLLSKEFEKDYSRNKQQLDEKSDELSAQKGSAQKLLDEKEKELKKAKKLLSEKRAEYSASQRDAEAMIAELDQAKEDLIESAKELAEKGSEIDSAYETANATASALKTQRDQLIRAKEGLNEIDAAAEKLKAAQTTLDSDGVRQLIGVLSSLPKDTGMSKLTDSAQRLSDILDIMRENGFRYDISEPVSVLESAVNDFIAQIDSDSEYLRSHKAAALIEAAEEYSSADPDYSELTAVLGRYSAATVTDAESLRAAYRSALSVLNAIHGPIHRPELQQALNLLKGFSSDSSAKELLDIILSARSELRDLSEDVPLEEMTVGQVTELCEKALKRISEALEELKSKRADITDELSANGIAESDLAETIGKLREGVSAAESACSDLDDLRSELENGLSDIYDGIAEIDGGIAEINEALRDGKSQLSTAESEINDGESQLARAAKDMKAFSDLEDELKRAYEKLGDSTNYDRLCNQFLLYLNDGADPDSVLDQAIAALDDATVKTGYTYPDSPVKKRIDANLHPVSSLMSLLPAIFFGVVLIVVFLFMSMIIHQSRRDLGILRALGFSKAALYGMFCIIAVGVAIGGIVIGSGIGLLVRGYIGGYFEDFFPLPGFTYLSNSVGFAVGAAATVGVCVSATLLGTAMIARVTPKEAMSRTVQTTINVPGFLDRILRKASPMLKFSLTSLLRNKGRFIFSAICVSASVMIIFTSVSFISSKNNVIRQTFEERIHYDCQIFFKDEPSEALIKEIKAVDGVSDTERLWIYDIAVSTDKASKKTNVYAIEPDTGMIGINDADGKPIALSGGGMIIEKHLAEALGGVAAGGELTVDSISFRVIGVTDQCVSRAQYIDLKSSSDLGKPELYSVLCKFDGEPRRELLASLSEHEEYLYSVFTDSLYEDNRKLFSTYDLAAWILIAFAVLTGFIIVLNTAITNLQDNKRELCVLRTLGFQHSEISRSRFSQSLLQFLAACLIGFISGASLARFALFKISSPTEEFLYVSGIGEALSVALIVFIYILVSHFFAMRTMKRWNHVEGIKDKE